MFNIIGKRIKEESGYTLGNGKGFGCIRCVARKNNKCFYIISTNNKIKLDGGCCNIWTLNIKGTEGWFSNLTKHQIGYIETTLGQKIECKECVYWQQGQCQIVSGVISPIASCNYWISRNKPTKQF